MVAVIDYTKCIHCGSCVQVCPTNAMQDGKGTDGKPKADAKVCTHSGECVKICPVSAIHLEGEPAAGKAEKTSTEKTKEATA